ncbi:hypothetical protein MLD38_033464 [Melastoma candidum]|uniref:Uncharacterized protein n=1 Tax=Melastoma candidum TaxID=119954 RepID=A0ACB9M7E6_9MYRT|nr:hypothetical protein MLD38_033464 [Melastoma candidum]
MGKRNVKQEAFGSCRFWVFLCLMGMSTSVVGKRVVYTNTTLLVNLTLIPEAASTGAVCLDGTLPGYHMHRGHGSGANRWLVQIEGGGWCNTVENCIIRKSNHRGSSKHMERQLPFSGILSEKAEENPDFFDWNRVKLRYCDGASFSGSGQDEAANLYFRGQQIWVAAMQHLLSQGMKDADMALLSGCSAGALASILHCDEFRTLFPDSTKVKCLSDAGIFLDAVDVTGGRALRDFFAGVVSLQDVQKNLPTNCTSRLNATLCFFPQNLLADIQTPLFLLNAAYDLWQIQSSLAPATVSINASWQQCRLNHLHCNAQEIQFLQDFRKQMLDAVNDFSSSNRSGVFINSCFAHCQTEIQDTWFSTSSPVLDGKRIAESVGDWYFERTHVKAIDCPYPCDKTCHNLDANDSTLVTVPNSHYSRLETNLTYTILVFLLIITTMKLFSQGDY